MKYTNWQENYYNNKNIELFIHFNKTELKVLKKLGIIIKNKLYSEYEFDLFTIQLLEYYIDEDTTIEELPYIKPLFLKKVAKFDYDNLVSKFENIMYNKT